MSISHASVTDTPVCTFLLITTQNLSRVYNDYTPYSNHLRHHHALKSHSQNATRTFRTNSFRPTFQDSIWLYKAVGAEQVSGWSERVHCWKKSICMQEMQACTESTQTQYQGISHQQRTVGLPILIPRCSAIDRLRQTRRRRVTWRCCAVTVPHEHLKWRSWR